MKKVFIVLLGMTLTYSSWADSISERLVRKADLLTYSLAKAGVKTLKFKMKVQGLKENLNNRKNFGVIKDLHFEVSWEYPQKIEIEVVGMPKGFNEVKEQLKMAVYSRLPLLFPAKKQEMIHGYKLNYDKQNEMIVAVDPTGKKSLNKMEIGITEDGLIKRVQGIGLAGNQETRYLGKLREWSKDKFVYDNISISVNAKASKTVITHELTYTTVRGIGVPQTILSRTKLVNTQDGSEKLVSSIESAFYDYVINGVK